MGASPERVRQAVCDYLEDQLGCLIRRHRLGFDLVTMTGRSREIPAPPGAGDQTPRLRWLFRLIPKVKGTISRPTITSGPTPRRFSLLSADCSSSITDLNLESRCQRFDS